MEFSSDMILVIGAGLAVMTALIGAVLLQTRTQQPSQLFDLSKRGGRNESRANPIQPESGHEQPPSCSPEPAINWQISFSGNQNVDDAISKAWSNLATRKADGSMGEWHSRLKQGMPTGSMLPQLMAMMEQGGTGSSSITVEVFNPGANPERLVSLIMKATGMETAEARALAAQTPVIFEVDIERMDYASLQQALQDAGIHSFQLRSQMQNTVHAEKMEQLAEQLGSMPIPGLGQSLFSGGPGIFLVDVGSNKIGVIKEIREATGLGLKEAKDIADHAPVRLHVSDSHSRDRLISALRDLGARVEIQ